MLMIWCFDPHMYAWSFILSNLQPSFITSGSKTHLLLIHSIPYKVKSRQGVSKNELWIVLCYNMLLLTLWIIFDVNYILHNTFIEFPVSELSLQNYRREASKRAFRDSPELASSVLHCLRILHILTTTTTVVYCSLC